MSRTSRKLTALVVTAATIGALVSVVGVTPAAAATGPKLTLAETWTPTNPTADDQIDITYTMTNTGDAPALGTVLEITVNLGAYTWAVVAGGCPIDNTYLDRGIPEQLMTCRIGTIAPGHTVTKVIGYRASAGYTLRFAEVHDAYSTTGQYVDPPITVAPGKHNPVSGAQYVVAVLLGLLGL